jgi:hypothetical protein
VVDSVEPVMQFQSFFTYLGAVNTQEWSVNDRSAAGPYSAVNGDLESTAETAKQSREKAKTKKSEKRKQRTVPDLVENEGSDSADEQQLTPIKDMKRSRRQLDEHTKGRDPLASVLKETQHFTAHDRIAEEARHIRTLRNTKQAAARGDSMPASLQRVKRSRELERLGSFLSDAPPDSPIKRTRATNKEADSSPKLSSRDDRESRSKSAKVAGAKASPSSVRTSMPAAVSPPGARKSSRSGAAKAARGRTSRRLVPSDSDSESGVESESTDAQPEYEVPYVDDFIYCMN